MPKREHERFLPGGHVFRSPGHVIDGGENYQYRGSDFADSKSYRKMTQPNLSPNYVIPLSLRNSWMINDNISFGIYDRQYNYGGPVMNPTLFTQCIVTGATQADELVWTYSEGRDFLTPVESPKTGWMPCGAREANWGCPRKLAHDCKWR